MQKLILPIADTMITAGYQNTAYRNKFGFSHYGCDMISLSGNRRVQSGGSGTVLVAGLDSTLGNILILRYPQAYSGRAQTAADLILRYCHLDALAVKAGDKVQIGTLLGNYGNTGKYSAGPHLHVEADYDTKYFAYSATVGKDGTLIKAGNAQTMCRPAEVLFIPKGTQTCAVSKAVFGGLPFVASADLPAAI